MLKECSNEISPILALIFNESLAQGDVPDEWRQANMQRLYDKLKHSAITFLSDQLCSLGICDKK